MTICIYHGNCADGFGAAWAVRKAIPDATFIAGHYGKEPPDVTGEFVVMVDFSYKRPVLLEMATKAREILILDHHKTAAADLVDLPRNVVTGFDMTRSGAMMAWDHFNNGAPAPALIQHIQDRDLWRFALPFTREIQAAVFSYPYDFEVWDKLMAMDINDLAKEGIALERKHFKDIRELLTSTTRRMVIGGHNVPVANLPYTMSSDAGHILGVGEPFAACYSDGPTARYFSLRSADDGVDVSAIAAAFGGGGHAHAAGFNVPYAVAATFEIPQ